MEKSSELSPRPLLIKDELPFAGVSNTNEIPLKRSSWITAHAISGKTSKYQPPPQHLPSISTANRNQSFPTKANREQQKVKSWKQQYLELSREKQAMEQSHDELINLLRSTQNELHNVKQQNSNDLPKDPSNSKQFAVTSNVRPITRTNTLNPLDITNDHVFTVGHNYEITTPRNSDIAPSECNEVLIIDDIVKEIVSNTGVDPDHDKPKKLLKVLQILMLLLNIIKKIIALFSTAFMIDCKLTGEGHFGIQCIEQIRVISVDNSFAHPPYMRQNGKEISIDALNEKEECLLPLCSCIHPSTLRWNSLINPDLYEKCFQNQCNNPENICLNKPNNSQCVMRNRMCRDINDWCGKPSWYPTNLPPADTKSVLQRKIEYQGKTEYIVTAEVIYSKIEFEINCENGAVCCRFLLGTDVTKEWYDENKIEKFLKTHCGLLYDNSVQHGSDEYDLLVQRERLRYVAPVHMNRDDIPAAQFMQLQHALRKLDFETFKSICNKFGIWSQCEQAINAAGDEVNTLLMNLKTNVAEVTFDEWILDTTSVFLTHYNENDLCLKVLLTTE